MITKKIHSTIIDIQNPISDVYTLTFESSKPFKYHPGQFLHFAIDEYDPSMQWPESRCFSMQSAPGVNTLKITYSVVGSFTRRMAKELKIGQQGWLKLPYGDLFQRGRDKTSCVLIAGGTGITPFLSLINDETFKEYPNPFLYLGFRNPDYNLYSEELELARIINPSAKIDIRYENTQGRLSIMDIYNEHENSTYYISGPPIMIKSFKQQLLDSGLSENRIITDDWI